MAEPTLEQMIDAAERRQAAPQLGLLELIKQLFYPKPQAPLNQMPRFDASGNAAPARTLNDVLIRRQ